MGASFAVFAGFYYWVEKITGRRYDQLWGAVQFWTLFIGVRTFAPGLLRVYSGIGNKGRNLVYSKVAWYTLAWRICGESAK